MNGFAEAAIGLAFATQLLALDTVFAMHFLDLDAKAQPVQAERHVATQKKMRNPWERTIAAQSQVSK